MLTFSLILSLVVYAAQGALDLKTQRLARFQETKLEGFYLQDEFNGKKVSARENGILFAFMMYIVNDQEIRVINYTEVGEFYM